MLIIIITQILSIIQYARLSHIIFIPMIHILTTKMRYFKPRRFRIEECFAEDCLDLMFEIPSLKRGERLERAYP